VSAHRILTSAGPIPVKKLLTGLFVVAFACLEPSIAAATLIDFSSFSQAGTGFNNLGTSVNQSGFHFTSTGGPVGDALGVWQASSPDHPAGGAATTSLTEFFRDSHTTMTALSGGTFALTAIDLAPWRLDTEAGVVAGTFSVTFTGRHPDNSTVTETFTVARASGLPVLQHFTFTGFTDLADVEAVQGVFVNGTAYQFDNIDVTVTPEPSTLLLLGSSLSALPVLARRRRSK